jgi:DNA-binding protein YbaB
MPEPDLEDLDRSLRESEDRLRRLDGFDETLKAVTAEYTTPDGLVTVELGADAAPRNLRLDPRAMRLQSFELSELILAAFAGAHGALQARTTELLTDVLGADATPTSVMQDAKQLEGTMTTMLSDLTKQMNDVILEVNRHTQRRGR